MPPMRTVKIDFRGNTYHYEVALVKMRVPGVKTLVGFRPGTTDLATFSQIFIRRAYELSTDVRPGLIIDGGANVGYASIWFANRFPEAEIIAVEPEGDNFRVLRENTLEYPNVRPVQAAIWNRAGPLKLVTHDGNKRLGHWGLRVEESDDPSKRNLQAVTIDELLDGTEHKRIDILKLDIEGAEKEVFSSNYARWLEKTNLLILELHDRFKPGCSESVYSAIRPYDFTSQKNGENIFFTRRTLLSE